MQLHTILKRIIEINFIFSQICRCLELNEDSTTGGLIYVRTYHTVNNRDNIISTIASITRPRIRVMDI